MRDKHFGKQLQAQLMIEDGGDVNDQLAIDESLNILKNEKMQDLLQEQSKRSMVKKKNSNTEQNGGTSA